MNFIRVIRVIRGLPRPAGQKSLPTELESTAPRLEAVFRQHEDHPQLRSRVCMERTLLCGRSRALGDGRVCMYGLELAPVDATRRSGARDPSGNARRHGR